MNEKKLMSKEKGSLDMKYLKNEMWLKIWDSTVNTSLLNTTEYQQSQTLHDLKLDFVSKKVSCDTLQKH